MGLLEAILVSESTTSLKEKMLGTTGIDHYVSNSSFQEWLISGRFKIIITTLLAIPFMFRLRSVCVEWPLIIFMKCLSRFVMMLVVTFEALQADPTTWLIQDPGYWVDSKYKIQKMPFYCLRIAFCLCLESIWAS